MVYVLRLIHIIGGVFWVGSAMFGTFLLMPSLRAAGPAAGPVMNQLGQVRKMPIVMMTSAIVTVVAGIWLLMIDSAGAPGVFMKSGPGRTFGIGAALSILGFLLGVVINMPAARRLGAIGATAAKRGSAPTPDEAAEMQRLQGRMSAASQIVTLLLLLATGAMAIARYVP
jgi:hypothetical protein